MNIFALDENPKLAAQDHHNIHTYKMISEARQMMDIALIYAKGDSIKGKGYVNHPCSIWVRESLNNFLWLQSLAFYLNEEYVKRFDKKQDHKDWTKIEKYILPNLPKIGMTDFALAMPDRYKQKDTIMSYRLYYFFEKRYYGKKTRRKSKWKNGKPQWIKLLEKEIGTHEFRFD